MITELFWTEGHSFAPGHEPTILDWVRYFINENTELLISIGSGFVSFYITLFCLRRIVAVVKRALRDPHAEEEAAQEALRKLAEAQAQREPRVRRRAGPGAVAPEGHGEDDGWDGMEAAPAGGYPLQYDGGPAARGSEGYGDRGYGAQAYGAQAYGAEEYRAEAAAHGADSGHAPRPGSFFTHRGARASR